MNPLSAKDFEELTSGEALKDLRKACKRLQHAYKNEDEHPEDPYKGDEIDYSSEWVHAAYKKFCVTTGHGYVELPPVKKEDTSDTKKKLRLQWDKWVQSEF